jgi:hypothetical protein
VFIVESADGGAGLAWGLLAIGAILAAFWLLVLVMLRVGAHRR